MKNSKAKKIAALIIIASMLECSCFAAEEQQFEYPELNVVPRASERIRLEAQIEPGRKMTQFLPIQISALATLGAGIAGATVANNPLVPPTASYVGIGVGGAWLIASTLLSISYQPYNSASQAISALPKGTSVRDQLMRERLSEEAIQNIASVGTRLKWFSIVTNLGASVFMATSKDSYISTGPTQERPAAHFLPYVSAALALTPLLFKSHWSEVQEQQANYKKRIYGPVARATFLADAGTRQLVPGFMLHLEF